MGSIPITKKTNSRNFTLEFLAYFLGVFYLSSSILKGIDVNYFATIVARYEVGSKIVHLSPLFITLEFILGVLFFKKFAFKGAALISIILLLIFSSVYAYGFNELGIKECGCFGRANVFSSSPLIVFIRNLTLGIVSYFIFKKTQFSSFKINITIIYLVALSFVCLFFLYSKLDNDKIIVPILKNDKVNMTALKAVFTDEKPYIHNKYLVYVFSPTCSHCWNQTENIKLYKTKGVVDSIVGVIPRNIGQNKIDFFIKNFDPNFNITPVGKDTINKLTFFFPIAYVVQNGVVTNILKREIPSPVTFKKYYK